MHWIKCIFKQDVETRLYKIRECCCDPVLSTNYKQKKRELFNKSSERVPWAKKCVFVWWWWIILIHIFLCHHIYICSLVALYGDNKKHSEKKFGIQFYFFLPGFSFRSTTTTIKRNPKSPDRIPFFQLFVYLRFFFANKCFLFVCLFCNRNAFSSSN